jgi:Ca-activated chloride channel homolog
MPRKSDQIMRKWVVGICAIFLLAVCCLPINIYSQESEEAPKQDRRNRAKPDLGTKNLQEPSEQQEQQGYKIGVHVDLVLTYTTVLDKTGRFVRGLKQENFKAFEDGVQQTIASFSQEDVPISMGILLDLSGSMRGKIDQVNKAALAFIKASNPQDQVFLVGFNDDVELLQDYTSDIDEITDALENTVVTGATAIYDAIYLGVQKAHTGIKPKKAIIVITDGEDNGSFYTLDEMVAKVQESDVQVFSIGFLNDIPKKSLFGGWSKSVPEKARDSLIKIAEETGGKAYFPDKLTDIHSIVSEIATELRSQYSIGYFSANSTRDGSFRRVKIEVNGAKAEGNQVRYRRGYYAPKADITQK